MQAIGDPGHQILMEFRAHPVEDRAKDQGTSEEFYGFMAQPRDVNDVGQR